MAPQAAHLNRDDPEVAQALFERLVPDHAAEVVAGLFTHAIRYVHGIGPSAWSLSLLNRKIRLNAGPVEVVTLTASLLTLVLAGDARIVGAGEPGVHLRSGPSHAYYKSVPIPSFVVAVDLATYSGRLTRFLEHLNVYLGEAAQRRRKSTFARAFSPGVLRFLERVTQSRLPFPGFVAPSDAQGKLAAPDEAERVLYYREGAVRQVVLNTYERDSRARRACLQHYGASCVVCGFSSDLVYGPNFAGIIHVHHLVPLSAIGSAYHVDPIRDLRPVCPNCHAAIHATNPPFSPEELRKIVGTNICHDIRPPSFRG